MFNIIRRSYERSDCLHNRPDSHGQYLGLLELSISTQLFVDHFLGEVTFLACAGVSVFGFQFSGTFVMMSSSFNNIFS